jgi:hypothetical protein
LLCIDLLGHANRLLRFNYTEPLDVQVNDQTKQFDVTIDGLLTSCNRTLLASLMMAALAGGPRC